MQQIGKDKNILLLTIPLAFLTALASYAGVFLENTYSRETMNYAAQGIGQDAVNLFIVAPLLLISALFAYRRNKLGLFIWSGALFYLVYSYTIYAFALHFNSLFLIYCMILGLSFYSFAYFMYTVLKEDITGWFTDMLPRKSIAIFFFVIAALFYALWLSEIIPALLENKTPASVAENGLLINPVHVLDLSICLPALIITGILLLKRKKPGFLLTPALLSFCVLMSVAIVAMVIVMKMNELEADMGLAVIFGIITFISIFFFIRYLRSLK